MFQFSQESSVEVRVHVAVDPEKLQFRQIWTFKFINDGVKESLLQII